MNTEINFFLITFIILLIILMVYFPISGYVEVKKLKKEIAEGDNSKRIKFYYSTIFWLWLPTALVFLALIISKINIENIGIKWIDTTTFSVPKWFISSSIGFYIIHLFFNVYSIITFKFNKKSREKAAKSVPEDFKWIFPVTRKEKKVWTFTSITAGITEEIIYRGYFFYTLKSIFPGLSIIHLLIITTLIFGIGHIYLGKDAIKSTLLGLIFGIYYTVFGSIIPVIIIHVTQDIVLRDIFEDSNKMK